MISKNYVQILTVAAGLLCLTACGSSTVTADDTSGTNAAVDPIAETKTGDDEGGKLTPEELDIKLNQCVEERSGIALEGVWLTSDDLEKQNAARDECDKKYEDQIAETYIAPTPEQLALEQDADAEYQNCMKEEGVESIGRGLNYADDEADKVEAAVAKCDKATEALYEALYADLNNAGDE